MSELRKELNQAIGTIRATREYLAEESKLLVDASIPGFPSILRGNKANIVDSLDQIEQTMLRCVEKLK